MENKSANTNNKILLGDKLIQRIFTLEHRFIIGFVVAVDAFSFEWFQLRVLHAIFG